MLNPFQDVSRCCSDRLDTFGKWIGVATLRSLEKGGVPEELQAEPVNRKGFLRVYSSTILIFFKSSCFVYCIGCVPYQNKRL